MCVQWAWMMEVQLAMQNFLKLLYSMRPVYIATSQSHCNAKKKNLIRSNFVMNLLNSNLSCPYIPTLQP